MRSADVDSFTLRRWFAGWIRLPAPRGFEERKGRLPGDDAVKNLIIQGADAPEIKREAAKNGMRTLRQSALRKLAEGVTTFEEVVRVMGL